MGRRILSAYRVIPFVFWMLAFAAIPVWNAVNPTNWWDAKIYLNAIHSMQAGHDPYADGIAAVTAFPRELALHPNAPPPFPYAYSPLTLPLLRMVGLLPASLYICGYWLIYAAAVLAQIWVSMQATEPKERRFFAFLAPAAAFFPGLIQNMDVWSGNIAYILYGLIFATALLGWRRGGWRWFYLAVLIASCFKIPFLSLLAIPVLSARKQWYAACVTGATGILLFIMQPWIWPTYFHNYLGVLGLLFSFFHDFGVGPAGLFGLALCDAGRPYSAASTIFYILYALPLFGLLLYLSRQFLSGKFTQEQWIPVMLTGVILVSPRIQVYDVAPLALFMALILWRTIAYFTRRAILLCLLFFGALNVCVITINGVDIHDYYWNHIEGPLLVAIFAAGCLNLRRHTLASNLQPATPAHESPVRDFGT